MKVLIVLCLATLALAEERRQLSGAVSTIARCELSNDCTSCCDSSFTGILGALEKPACHLACRVLPGGDGKKRQLLGQGVSTIAQCELSDDCTGCCDSSFTGILGALEKPACHLACRFLPGGKKRQLVTQGITTIARCEVSNDCTSCCDESYSGLLGAIEGAACRLACRVLPGGDGKKRQLITQGITTIARCEVSNDCTSCCDESYSGLLGAIEGAACRLACRVLPGGDGKKRQLIGQGITTIARCEVSNDCTSCCDESYSGILGAIEGAACRLACRVLPGGDGKKRQLITQGITTIARCEVSNDCTSCCDESYSGLLGAIEGAACRLACRVLPGGDGKKRQLIGQGITTIARCEVSNDCTSCCDESYSGLLGAIEGAACRLACRVLPGGDGKKRQLISQGISTIARCEVSNDCTSCCDSSYSGILAAIEGAACHLACRILPGGDGKKRQIIGQA